MATMTSGLGGAAGYGENSFKTNGVDYASDGPYDDAAVQIDITSVFGPSGINFFGTDYTDIWVNSNGLITFDDHDTSYNPTGIGSLSQPAIAPFWTDIDIENGGDIYWDIDPTAGTVTITWLDVRAYSNSGGAGSNTNSFQVVLTDNGNGDFNVEFIYEDIDFSDGGGGVATAGITDGGSSDFEVEGSGNSSSVLAWDTTDFDGAGGDPSGVFSLSVEDGEPSVFNIDGTSGDDDMALGYVDVDGDAITTGDNVIDGGAGDDSIDGDGGNDTILGGAGDDTILSGSTTGGSVSWTSVGSGANITGTSGVDYYSWSANNGSSATIRLNNSASSGDGDGVADYVLIETTNNIGTLTIGDFDMGTDKIVLQEMYANIVQSGGSGYYDVTITYSGGNQQDFRLFTDDGYFDSTEVFTTTEPTVPIDDDDSLSGGDDADTFVISDDFGADTIIGGEGGTDEDTIDVSGLTNAVTLTYSGDEAGTLTDGSDTLEMSEVEALILTDQDDIVYGEDETAGMDIQAGAGDDDVRGGSGDDDLDGNSGADTLSGDGGSDTISGGSGADMLAGGTSGDSISGGDGADNIRGDNVWLNPNDHASSGGSATNLTVTNSADDPIELWYIDGSGSLAFYQTINAGDTYVQSTFDTHNWILRDEDGYYLKLIEGAPNQTVDYGAEGLGDTLSGDDGDDTILGEYGDDSIDGGADDDSIVGGSGDDTMLTGTGDDYADGGDDADTFVINDGFGTDTLIGGEGGTDDDTIDLSALTGAVTVTFSGSEAGTITDGADTITFSEIENIFLTDQDDSLDGLSSSAAMTVDGGDGNDTITGGNGADSILGGDGNDVLDGDDDDDTIDGGAGDDTILAGYGSDIFIGGTGTDTYQIDGTLVEGFAFNIDLVAGSDGYGNTYSGIENIIGGHGNDTLAGDGNDNVLDGDDGADLFTVSDGFGADTIIGGEGGTDSDTIDLSSLTGTVTVTYSGDEAGTITDGVNTITFSQIETLILTDQADSVDGTNDSAGLDIDAGDGADTVLGGSGDDVVTGGDGADSLTGGVSGADTLDGGDGHDTIASGSDADSVSGGAGNDVIYNGSGNDTVDGGSGADTIYADQGDDSLSGGDGDDTFVISTSFGNDTIIGGEGSETNGDTIDLSALTTSVTVTYSGDEVGTVTDSADTISFSQIEALILTDQADTVDATADTAGTNIDAGDGNDYIEYGQGDSTVLGGAGDDYIDGVAGSNTTSSDSLDGGDGNDTIWASDGDDTVLGGADNDLLVGGDGDDSIDGGTGADNIYGGSQADTIDGGSGDDTLRGESGDDSITGGDGDDTFVYAVGGGHDTITDFNSGNSGTLDDGDSSNNDAIDLSAFYDNLSELYADQADDGILNQSNATDTKGRSTDYSDNSEFGAGDSITFTGASGDNSSFTQENTGVVCFTSGTAIRTPQGDVLIDDLKVGDLVTTIDNGPQKIRWIGKTSHGPQALARNAKLRPILFKRAVLGAVRDVMVSPQHGMLLNRDHLVRATHLAETMPGVRVANGRRSVTYFHILFEAHQVIFAENMPSESFYPGPWGIKMMSKEARQSLFAALPAFCGELTKAEITEIYGPTARAFLQKRDLKHSLRAA